jgi:hypothetical protein
LALFDRVFQETKERFVFEIRGLQLAEDGLQFYIKPDNGLQLPVIMKWLKQVFAQRYNRAHGWEGHIWGDRYGSRILAGEPPLPGGTPEMKGGGEEAARVRPRYGKIPHHPPFSLLFPLLFVRAPG